MTMTDRPAERRGLGRGLGELFQRTEPTAPPTESLERSAADGSAAGEPGAGASTEDVASPTPIPDGSYFAEVALESTYGWYWAADALAELGATVHLAHTRSG